jgi:hypothetical protein
MAPAFDIRSADSKSSLRFRASRARTGDGGMPALGVVVAVPGMSAEARLPGREAPTLAAFFAAWQRDVSRWREPRSWCSRDQSFSLRALVSRYDRVAVVFYLEGACGWSVSGELQVAICDLAGISGEAGRYFSALARCA